MAIGRPKLFSIVPRRTNSSRYTAAIRKVVAAAAMGVDSSEEQREDLARVETDRAECRNSRRRLFSAV